MEKIRPTIKGGPGSGFHGHAGRPGKVGGSAPPAAGPTPEDNPEFAPRKPDRNRLKASGYGYSHLPPELVDQIRAEESRIAHFVDHEEMAIYAEDGRVWKNAAEITGGEEMFYSIDFPQNFDINRDGPGSIVTHNHPLGTSLSTADIVAAVWGGFKEIRAVTPDVIYHFFPNPAERYNQQYRHGTAEFMEQIIDRASVKLKSEWGIKVALGEMDVDYANANHQHEVLTRVMATPGMPPFDYRVTNRTQPKASVKGGAGSGYFGHAGRPGEVGGSAPDGSEPAPEKMTKLDTGSVGEKAAIRILSEFYGVDFETVNKNVNNAPFDVIGDHLAVEVKTGLTSNRPDARKWRATIGQPGKAEAAALAQMTPEEKRAHNERKNQAILDRKGTLLRRMAAEMGENIDPVTVGLIVSPDGKHGDLYMIPGFHLILRWSQYAVEENRVATFDGESIQWNDKFHNRTRPAKSFPEDEPLDFLDHDLSDWERKALDAALAEWDRDAEIVLARWRDFMAGSSVKGGPGSGFYGHAGRPGEVGGSAPDGSESAPEIDPEKMTGYEDLPEALIQPLATEESRIAQHADFEEVIVFDPSGAILSRDQGKLAGPFDAIGVTPSITGSQLAGKIVTHNHPRGGLSFSLEDMRVALQANVQEERVVGRDFLYRFRPKLGWKSMNDEDRKYTLIDLEVAFYELSRSMLSVPHNDKPHLVNTKLAERFSDIFEYDRYLRNQTSVKGGPGSGYFGHAGRPGKVGGSAPDGTPNAQRPHSAYDRLPHRLVPEIQAEEDRISSIDNHEEIAIWSLDGRVWKNVGPQIADPRNGASVEPPEEFDWQRDGYNTIVTHNHPRRSSFSPDDLQIAIRYGLREVRAVTNDYIYRFAPNRWAVRDEESRHQMLWLLMGKYSKVDRAVKREWGLRITIGSMSIDDANDNHEHEVMTRLTDLLGSNRFSYQRISRHSAPVKGGPGSGYFGHAGRPGEVGGSAPDGAGPEISAAPEKPDFAPATGAAINRLVGALRQAVEKGHITPVDGDENLGSLPGKLKKKLTWATILDYFTPADELWRRPAVADKIDAHVLSKLSVSDLIQIENLPPDLTNGLLHPKAFANGIELPEEYWNRVDQYIGTVDQPLRHLRARLSDGFSQTPKRIIENYLSEIQEVALWNKTNPNDRVEPQRIVDALNDQYGISAYRNNMQRMVENKDKSVHPYDLMGFSDWKKLKGASWQSHVAALYESYPKFQDVLSDWVNADKVSADQMLDEMNQLVEDAPRAARKFVHRIVGQKVWGELIDNGDITPDLVDRIEHDLQIGVAEMAKPIRDRLIPFARFADSTSGEMIKYPSSQNRLIGEFRKSYARRVYDPISQDLLEKMDVLDSAASDMKNKIVTELAGKSGMPSEDAHLFVKQWSVSSNDTDMRSLGIQEQAETIGAVLSPWQRKQIEVARSTESGSKGTYLFQGYNSSPDDYKSKIRSLIKAAYENTQARLADHKVKKIAVYRGMIVPIHQLKGAQEGDVIEVEENALSSWSTSYRAALEFSNHSGSQVVPETGIILSTVIPASEIYSTAISGPGSLSEEEVIAISTGRKRKARIVYIQGGNYATKASVKGGPGSGFYGHAGRPGEVGGSAPDGTANHYSESDRMRAVENFRGDRWDSNDVKVFFSNPEQPTPGEARDLLDAIGMNPEQSEAFVRNWFGENHGIRSSRLVAKILDIVDLGEIAQDNLLSRSLQTTDPDKPLGPIDPYDVGAPDDLTDTPEYDGISPIVAKGLYGFEQQTRHVSDHEEMRIVDRYTGTIVAQLYGEKIGPYSDGATIFIPSPISRKMYGAVATHNHPFEIGFSSDDILTAYFEGWAEIRAVTPKYTYRARLGFDLNTTPPTNAKMIELRNRMERISKRNYNLHTQDYRTGKISRDEAGDLWSNGTMLDFAAETPGFIYERIPNRQASAKGGPGSGFHGHAGRPGEVGGSAPSTTGPNDGTAPGKPDGDQPDQMPWLNPIYIGIPRETIPGIIEHETMSAPIKDHEELAGYDRQGKMIFTATGGQADENGDFSAEIPKEVVHLLPGSIVTHNHPLGSSFSSNDIMVLLSNNLSEIRAVTPDYVYRARLLRPVFPAEVQTYSDEIDILLLTTKIGFLKQLIGGTSPLENANDDMWHRLWQEFTKDHLDLFFYQKISRADALQSEREAIDRRKSEQNRQASAKGGPGSGFYGHAGRPGEVGGSAPPAAGHNDPIYAGLPTTLAKKLKALESRIAEISDHEEGSAFDDRGNLIVKMVPEVMNDTFALRYPDGFDPFVAVGGIFTHNHPSGGSFSPEDIRTACMLRMTEVRAVTTKWVHRFRIDARQYGNLMSKRLQEPTELADDLSYTYHTILRDKAAKMASEARQRAYTNDPLTVKEMNERFGHDAMTEFVESFPNLFTYERLPRHPEPAKAIKGGPGSGFYGHAGRPGKVGGSAPSTTGPADPDPDATALRNPAVTDLLQDGGYAGIPPRHALFLRDNEDLLIQIKDREEMIIIGADDRIWKSVGEESDPTKGSHVGLPADLNVATDAMGAIMTHNHPRGSSFSVNDAYTAMVLGLKEVRAVTPEWIHRLIYKQSVYNLNARNRERVSEIIASRAEFHYQSVLDEWRAKLNRGELDFEWATANLDHEYMTRLANELANFMEYSRVPRSINRG